LAQTGPKKKYWAHDEELLLLVQALVFPQVGDVELSELQKFTHMETVEPEKLEWMKDLEEPKTSTLPPDEFSARWDSNP